MSYQEQIVARALSLIADALELTAAGDYAQAAAALREAARSMDTLRKIRDQ